ncbi:hypothetical protein [uncultured Selenomonas sp.]|uniref:hypothetical protein n=1 Tax=uncultured Selenomonas sp. TaxID=159275 RepID=UPI0028EA4600|nr:hypothetical protein [uncultured Selenomonas sp.]
MAKNQDYKEASHIFVCMMQGGEKSILYAAARVFSHFEMESAPFAETTRSP